MEPQQSRKRVVLVYPSNKFGGSVQARVELPLAVLAVGTPLDKAGYQVKIIDQRVDDDWRQTLGDELKRNPICVGISSMTGPQIKGGLDASRLVKEHPGIPVVWGGIHATLTPDQTVAHPDIDVVVQGEGEESFLELVKAFESGAALTEVRGIWYKEHGEVRKTEPRPPIDLNAQPPIAYHLVDIKHYLINVFGTDHLSLETSRGCPFRCGYCYNTRIYGGRWRGLTPDEAVRRVKIIVEELGVRGILFTDDNFFGKHARAIEILSRIRDAGLGVMISKIDAHVAQLNRLTDEEMGLLRQVGCTMVMMGIESGSPEILKMLNKRMKISDLLEFNQRLHGSGIRPHYFFMMGFPNETLERLGETLALEQRLSRENPEGVPRYNIFTPYPGTPLFDIAVEAGFEPPRSLEEWISFNYRTVHAKATWLSAKQKKTVRMLHFATLLAQRNNFINPYKKTSLWVKLAAAAYYPIARFRVQHLVSGFPVELKMAELLGVYPKQTA